LLNFGEAEIFYRFSLRENTKTINYSLFTINCLLFGHYYRSFEMFSQKRHVKEIKKVVRR